MRFFGLRVYDVRLWAGEPASATNWAALPLALEIEYARELQGAADRRALAEGDAARRPRSPPTPARAGSAR